MSWDLPFHQPQYHTSIIDLPMCPPLCSSPLIFTDNMSCLLDSTIQLWNFFTLVIQQLQAEKAFLFFFLKAGIDPGKCTVSKCTLSQYLMERKLNHIIYSLTIITVERAQTHWGWFLEIAAISYINVLYISMHQNLCNMCNTISKVQYSSDIY